MPDAAPSIFDALDVSSATSGWKDLESAWGAYAARRSDGATPFAAAVGVASRADRLGHAFAVGYPAALERLVPGVGLPPALCVTEDGGNSPKAVMTTLEAAADGYRLQGTKSFVTFGSLAEELIVASREGVRPDGRPQIAVVRIPAARGGVIVEELLPTPFVPEVLHARLRLEGVEVRPDERLPGDGYLDYVKPFRTIEDIHVIGATVGYVVGWLGRNSGDANLIARLFADLAALDSLQVAPPLDPKTHVALQGSYSRILDALRGSEFRAFLASASSDERLRWERDQALLTIAKKARDARFESAKRALGLDS